MSQQQPYLRPVVWLVALTGVVAFWWLVVLLVVVLLP